MKSLFIVLDGVEGCGKSSQLALLADRLRAEGQQVVVTHEPGGTPVGERIRALLLDPAYPEMTPLAEVMLFCASRAQHCAEVIAPALAQGRTVLCDRFSSATAAYQGHAGGVEMEVVEAVNRLATAGLEPDLLIILDLDPAVGLKRKYGDQAAAGDRIEEKSAEFHRAVREGFLRHAERCADRAAVVQADADPRAVHAEILRLIREKSG